MRLGIKGKQVLYVTSIVVGVVVVLSLIHLARLARVSLEESRSRAELLANAIYHRAFDVVATGANPAEALRMDPGLRSLLESSLYGSNVTFAALADAQGFAVAHADRAREGLPIVGAANIDELLSQPPLMQLRAIYSDQGRNLEVRKALLLDGATDFGSIRVGVSTLLIRSELNTSLSQGLLTAVIALTVAVFVATVLAQLLLRPIHVIRSGLTRLGRGEFGVRLDLNQQDEFGELGTFFNTVSAQLSADRSQMAGQVANLESAVERLEDAVAIVSPKGHLLFANPAMRGLLPEASAGAELARLMPGDHPMIRLMEQTLASRQSRGPIAASFADGLTGDAVGGERLIQTHPVNDAAGNLVGVMLIVRNLEYLSQVQSTVRYSRKLAALGRLSAGVAHEVKNPLNAMMIHLELLRQQFSARSPVVERRASVGLSQGATALAAVAPQVNEQALQHVEVIAAEIRRLDEVVQGFLKFTRPEDLKLQPVTLATLLDEVIPIVRPEAERTRVQLSVECDGALEVNGDPAMLRQAFLNLALNACQAMPQGGALTIRCAPARRGRVSITFADTGVGIRPEHLNRIFDLYFTTKDRGSGIGLSMVYRTVQMHDGEIEVQSTPGKGTTFRVLLPKA
jgi:signal transduction histidine kinase